MRVILYILVIMSLLLMSCDKIKTMIIDEFNSEKAPLRPNKTLAFVNETFLEEDEISTTTPSYTFYVLRTPQASITAVGSNYLLKITGLSNSILACGGGSQKLANSMNDLVFFNQWSTGIIRPSALVLLTNSPQNLVLNITLVDPKYDPASGSAVFTMIAEEPLRAEFLKKPLSPCLLLIEAEEQGF